MFLKTDVWEDGSEIVVEVELPGVGPNQLEVSCDARVLRIRGERSLPRSPRRYRRQERRCGPFERMIPLPARVSVASVDATLRDGVLVVRLAIEAKGREEYDEAVPVGRGVSLKELPEARLDTRNAANADHSRVRARGES